VTRVEVARGGEAPEQLDFISGSLTIGAEESVRRSATIEVVDTEGLLGPVNPFDIASPLTAQLNISSGVRYADGTEEVVPCGTVRVTGEDLDEAGGANVLRLACFDESVRAQGKLPRPLAIPNGTNVATAVTTLVADRVPTFHFRIMHTPHVTPALLIREESNAWTEAMELAETAGGELYVDRNNDCVMDPKPLQANDTYVWHFEEGENADFWAPKRRISSDLLPNVVVVVGTHSSLSAPVRGEAADTDPRSPTYRFGRYGEVVDFIRSEKVFSLEHATALAQARLARELGPSDEVTFSAIPNPALDIGDTIAVTRERLGLDHRRMLVTRMELPLTVEGEMTVTARRSVQTKVT